MKYTYYHQNRTKENSLRRYEDGSEEGQRWCSQTESWVSQCAKRETCITTNDNILTPREAEYLFPGSTK